MTIHNFILGYSGNTMNLIFQSIELHEINWDKQLKIKNWSAELEMEKMEKNEEKKWEKNG